MRSAERGFSLIETLVATTIVIVGLSGLAQLFVVSSVANLGAKSATVATMLAQDKMEELVALAGSGFRDSDYIDAHGRLLGTGGLAPPGTVYVRHWSIEPLSESAAGLCVWEVSVIRVGARGGNEAARIVGLRMRRAP